MSVKSAMLLKDVTTIIFAGDKARCIRCEYDVRYHWGRKHLPMCYSVDDKQVDDALLLYQRHTRLAVDLAGPLLADLDAAQISHLAEHTTQRQQDVVKRYLDPDSQQSSRSSSSPASAWPSAF